MRKLVTLRTISAINAIPKADAIEVATVDGWQCVVKKGEFQVGQVVVYFEIDSVLPAGRPEFEFLMARSRKNCPVVNSLDEISIMDGHRLRTIKLRGQVSQGLVFPLGTQDLLLEDLARGVHSVLFHREGEDGEFFDHRTFDDDLSDIFGVQKYEKQVPASLAGMMRGNYPAWLSKTDQERVQNCHRSIPDGPFYKEEKVEGSSMTVYHDGESLGVTSRNVDLILDQEGNTYVDVAKASGIFPALEELMAAGEVARVAVRGELIGPGIQDNIYCLSSFKFHIFDVWLDSRYLTTEERHSFIELVLAKHVDQNVVQCARPLGTVVPSELSVDEIVAMADGQSDLYPTPREGLVFKSAALDRHNQVFSFKAISPAYLLKEKE